MPLARLTCAALPLLLLMPLWAGDDDDEDEDRRGDNRKVWQAALVPIATLGVSASTGNDPLEEGSIQVSARGNVEVKLEKAAPNTAYTVSFCRFQLVNVGCMGLLSGTISTNADGNAKAEMQLPVPAANWSGIFLLSRGADPQFATAFTTRSAMPPPGAEIDIKGRIGALDPASNSFRLDSLPVPVFVTSRTNLVKFDSLRQLRLGDRVEVRGISINGFIEATRVKSED